MSNFRKIVRHFRPQHGGMDYVCETPGTYDNGVQRFHLSRESMQEKFTRENEMPVSNFTLEAQLQSGVPLQEMNPVIFKGDPLSAGDYLSRLSQEPEQIESETE